MSKKTNKDFKDSPIDVETKGAPSKGKFSSRTGKAGKPFCGDAKNDVSWYKHYPQLVEAQSSIIFNKPMGALYNSFKGLTGTNVQKSGRAIAGVLVADVTPLTGATGSSVDAINVAAKNAYTFVRHANSGHVNYESSDLYEYWIATSDIQALAEQYKMILRLIMTYKATNRYAYKAVLSAMGFNNTFIADLQTNYAQYVGALNVIIAQLNALKVPKDMDIYKRRAWLGSHVWMDAGIDKASFYVFKHHVYAHYVWATPTTPGKIVYYDNTYTGLTSFQLLINRLAAEINNLLGYEDIGIMIGDTLKAYGDGACVYIEPVALGDIQEAQYEPEVLNQFRNMTVTPGIKLNNLEIRQSAVNSQLLEQGYDASVTWASKGVIYGMVDNDLSTTGITSGPEIEPVLVMDSDAPSNDEVILATRLTCVLDYTNVVSLLNASNGDASCIIKAFGTEVVVSAVLYAFDETTAGFSTYRVRPSGIYGNGICEDLVKVNAVSRALDYFPQLFYVITTTAIRYGVSLLDGENDLQVSAEWLTNLHDGCRMSLYTLPMFKLLEGVK